MAQSFADDPPGLPGDALDGQTGAAEYCTGKTEYRKDEKEDDGNAVYEIDEECMVKRRVNKEREGGERRSPLPEVKNSSKQQEK